MKNHALVRWRRKAIAVKQLADRSQTPFVRRGLMQVVATSPSAPPDEIAHGAVVLPSVTDSDETPLQMAEWHIAGSEAQIALQKEMNRDAHSEAAATGRRVLEVMEETLRVLRRHAEMLRGPPAVSNDRGLAYDPTIACCSSSALDPAPRSREGAEREAEAARLRAVQRHGTRCSRTYWKAPPQKRGELADGLFRSPAGLLLKRE